jgi:hypothetical protein
MIVHEFTLLAKAMKEDGFVVKCLERPIGTCCRTHGDASAIQEGAVWLFECWGLES